jgi:hypothetical protein
MRASFLFGFSAVASLVVATVVACSTTETPGTPPVVVEEAGDAAGEPEDAGVDAPRVKGCPGETPTTYLWQAPVAKETSACTDADLAKLARAIADKALVVEGDITAALGASCAACAVGRVEDATWRAVVAGHDGYIGNVGGCAVRLGANETCGKAIDTLSTCLIVGCDGCADRKAQDACSDQLTTVDGACAPALTTMRKQCPAKVLASAFDTDGVCQSFVETIRLFCGPAAQDGG